MREVISRKQETKMMGRFFPYLGGKTALMPLLLKMIPAHSIYVEVFGGSAELLFSKTRSKTEVYNDINGDLVNLFMVVRDHDEAFKERLEWLLQSRETHEKWKTQFKTNQAPQEPIERAARFYYILCTQFAGKMWGGWAYARIGRRYWGEHRIKILGEIHRRLQRVHIERNDFRKILRTWDTPDTFFFCDPPYLDTTGYRQGFSRESHIDLAKALAAAQGKWLLTIGDHPLMWKLYGEYQTEIAETSLAAKKTKQGEKRNAVLRNLIIRNYDLGDPSQSILGQYLMEVPVVE